MSDALCCVALSFLSDCMSIHATCTCILNVHVHVHVHACKCTSGLHITQGNYEDIISYSTSCATEAAELTEFKIHMHMCCVPDQHSNQQVCNPNINE